jgi:hypothetical protein
VALAHQAVTTLAAPVQVAAAVLVFNILYLEHLYIMLVVEAATAIFQDRAAPVVAEILTSSARMQHITEGVGVQVVAT